MQILRSFSKLNSVEKCNCLLMLSYKKWVNQHLNNTNRAIFINNDRYLIVYK